MSSIHREMPIENLFPLVVAVDVVLRQELDEDDDEEEDEGKAMMTTMIRRNQ